MKGAQGSPTDSQNQNLFFVFHKWETHRRVWKRQLHWDFHERDRCRAGSIPCSSRASPATTTFSGIPHACSHPPPLSLQKLLSWKATDGFVCTSDEATGLTAARHSPAHICLLTTALHTSISSPPPWHTSLCGVLPNHSAPCVTGAHLGEIHSHPSQTTQCVVSRIRQAPSAQALPAIGSHLLLLKMKFHTGWWSMEKKKSHSGQYQKIPEPPASREKKKKNE